MPEILASVACNLDRNLLQATLPLFMEEQVEAIEWSFDTLFKVRDIPDWFVQLLREFGAAGRLVGHGVYFSLFSGRWTPEQDNWLKQLRRMSGEFKFDHISEHFGFLTGEHFHKGAPLSVPLTNTTLALGIDRLQRIAEAAGVPVGLENLAFSFSPEEVRRQGEFLDRLLQPVDGFLILDLHNVYCQLENFGMEAGDLPDLLPLERVREIHISGGSWEPTDLQEKPIRRDTHDHGVPDAVFGLLETHLPHCPNVKFVVLEQIGVSLDSEAKQVRFRQDFGRMAGIVHAHNASAATNPFLDFKPIIPSELPPPLEAPALAAEQEILSELLEQSADLSSLRQGLATSSLAKSDWDYEGWTPAMLETAMKIAQKWKEGWRD